MRKLVVSIIGLTFVFALGLSLAPLSNASNPEKNDAAVLLSGDFDLEASMTAGKAIYEGKGTCAVCHQVTGLGLPPAFPPLAKADYLLADKQRAVKQTMYGAKSPITVNGVTYPGGMMSIVELNDEEVRDVVNYILNSWGNNGGSVTVDDVKAARK